MPDPQTIGAVVTARSQHNGDRRALVTTADSITYAELDDVSAMLAARLVAAGVGHGSRVGLIAENGIEWATTAVAVVRVGAVLVPLSTLLRPPELLDQLRTAAASHLIATTGFRGRMHLDELEEVAPMTESCGPYCGDRLDTDLPEAKFGSCGRPFEHIDVKIADPDSGAPRDAGRPGEIWLRGPGMLRGICGREREEVFTPDGYYRAGDLGHLDDDGYLWYAARLDDMFKVKVATVYVTEVESALRALGSVDGAHVIDVETTDGSNEVGALVVTGSDPVAVVHNLRQRLSAFKVPSRWIFTTDSASVPVLASGKIDRRALRGLIREMGKPETALDTRLPTAGITAP